MDMLRRLINYRIIIIIFAEFQISSFHHVCVKSELDLLLTRLLGVRG